MYTEEFDIAQEIVEFLRKLDGKGMLYPPHRLLPPRISPDLFLFSSFPLQLLVGQELKSMQC